MLWSKLHKGTGFSCVLLGNSHLVQWWIRLPNKLNHAKDFNLQNTEELLLWFMGEYHIG